MTNWGTSVEDTVSEYKLHRNEGLWGSWRSNLKLKLSESVIVTSVAAPPPLLYAVKPQTWLVLGTGGSGPWCFWNDRLVVHCPLINQHHRCLVAYRYQSNMAKEVLDTIMSIQPKDSAGGSGETRETIVYRLADDMLSKLPEDYLPHEVYVLPPGGCQLGLVALCGWVWRLEYSGKPADMPINGLRYWQIMDPGCAPMWRLCSLSVLQVKERLCKMGGLQPLNILLHQEINCMRKVITTIRNTLTDLKLAIEGTIIMNEVWFGFTLLKCDRLGSFISPPPWLPSLQAVRMHTRHPTLTGVSLMKAHVKLGRQWHGGNKADTVSLSRALALLASMVATLSQVADGDAAHQSLG